MENDKVTRHKSTMNADITINNIAFKKSYDEKSGSLRRNTSRGTNLPDDLIIKSSAAVDQTTKVPGQRFLAQLNRTIAPTDGRKSVISAHFVLAIPENAPTEDINSVVATLRAAVAMEGFIESILNSER